MIKFKDKFNSAKERLSYFQNLTFFVLPVAMLTATNRAREILDNPMYEGALTGIQKITGVIDNGFSMFISLTAFFIIMAGLAKNVVAGAYVAWPDLWDKVDECHKAYAFNKQLFTKDKLSSWLNGDMQGSSGGQGGHSTVAMICYTLLPNFKAMTPWKDGEDSGNVQAKDYFIKAIPQLVAIVFIGIFIYNGYYKQVTIKATDFGSEVFDRVISSTDPMALVDKAIGSVNKPEFESSLGKDMKSKAVNNLSSKIYDQVAGVYTDFANADVRRTVAGVIETKVEGMFAEAEANFIASQPDAGDIWNQDRYSVAFTVTREQGVADEAKIKTPNKDTNKNRVRKPGIDQLYQWFAISDLMTSLDLGDKTLQSVGTQHSIRIVVQWTRKLEKSETNSSKQVTVTAKAPGTTVDPGKEANSASFLNGASIRVGSTGTGTYYKTSTDTTGVAITFKGGTTASPEVKITNGGKAVIAFTEGSRITDISGLTWVPGDGPEHPVKVIHFTGTGFKAEAQGGFESTSISTSPTITKPTASPTPTP